MALTIRAWRRLTAATAFALSLLTYILTLEPDASFWDCPEYLVTAALLEVGHPPGNPVWTLTAHIFALFGGTNPSHIAIAVNLSSALFTSGAVAILASLIFMMTGFLLKRKRRDDGSESRKDDKNYGRSHGAYISFLRAIIALAGALTFAWSDSAWFSAVEAEVYAMSLFLTALTVRLTVGAIFIRNRAGRYRRLLLIVYLTGLSIGVHQLNLLVIPALFLILLFGSERYREEGSSPGFLRIIETLILGAVAVGGILLGFMPGLLYLAGLTELFCVNRLGWPLFSGVWLFWMIAAIIFFLLPLLAKLCKKSFRSERGVITLQTLLWIPFMLLTGYSSYMLLLVRGAANPPMNEAAPTNIFALQEYLNRDQYGHTPLLYGRTPYSRVMRIEKFLPDSTPDYSEIARIPGRERYMISPDGKSYISFGRTSEPVYTPELNMWFPRLTSSNSVDIDCYADWAGMTPENMESVGISYAFDSSGNPVGQLNRDGSRGEERELRPTYLQHLRYLGAYQMGYMYFRYLLWNYSGRQNDRFATGEAEHGNFITGFPLLDNAMLGPQESLPAEIGAANRGHNVFFLIPLLIGIIGMICLQRAGYKGRRINLVLTILFLMTGVAIVVYLNQSPREPRERDYSFLGSFWTYALWISAGLAALVRLTLNGASKLRRAENPSNPIATPLPLLFIRKLTPFIPLLPLLLPAWMLYQNYDDHDRSNRRATTDYALNLLESLEPDAILFTNGDNYTFPLWWAQEVAGARRDVTVVSTAYIATPWYVSQLRQEQTLTPPLQMMRGEPHIAVPGLSLSLHDSLLRDKRLTAIFYDRSEVIPSRRDSLNAVDLKIIMDSLRNALSTPGRKLPRWPAMIRIGRSEGDTLLLRSAAVASGSTAIGFKQLMTLDILASNAASRTPRPVYWLSPLPSNDFGGFYPLTTRALHTRRLIYSDSLTPDVRERLLDEDMRGARRNHSGVADHTGDFYADASVGPQLTMQRLGLLRLAERLLEAGRPAEAAEVAGIVLRDYPAERWEYQICNESEGTLYEGGALANILLRTADSIQAKGLRAPGTVSQTNGIAARGDSIFSSAEAMRAAGERLIEREKNRRREWLRYYRTLPPGLRPALTPKHRQFIRDRE